MSVEDAGSYLRRLATDKEFVAIVKAAQTSAERLAVIHAAGYDFTLQELAEARSFELSDEESRKIALSDEELTAIAGGSGCGWTHESEGHCGKTHESEGCHGGWDAVSWG
ncbi:MAG: Nif11-like leader peptide family RiPP precursor [Actinomycetes bacterium]